MWGLRWQKKLSVSQNSPSEGQGILECTQAHPPRNQHQGSTWKGTIHLWVVGEVTESGPRAEQAALFPLWPLPHRQHHNAVTWVALPWWTSKAPPLTSTRHTKIKTWPKWKNRPKLQKNTTKEQRDSQPTRCRIQNTGNQDAHRIGWVCSQNTGKREGYEKWNKQKSTGHQQWRVGNQDSN